MGATLFWFAVAGIMDEVEGLLDRYARSREESMNATAVPVVSLLKRVAPPPTPKSD